jgi:hypothetical protein
MIIREHLLNEALVRFKPMNPAILPSCVAQQFIALGTLSSQVVRGPRGFANAINC